VLNLGHYSGFNEPLSQPGRGEQERKCHIVRLVKTTSVIGARLNGAVACNGIGVQPQRAAVAAATAAAAAAAAAASNAISVPTIP